MNSIMHYKVNIFFKLATKRNLRPMIFKSIADEIGMMSSTVIESCKIVNYVIPPYGSKIDKGIFTSESMKN